MSTYRIKWKDLVANLQDSIEGLDDQALMDLASDLLLGQWEYDTVADEYICTKENVMRKIDLDEIDSAALLDFPIDMEIDGFDADTWKRVWIQAAGYWWEDGGSWYDYIVNGFKGWAERTPYEVYCDLRFTYIDGQDKTWDELAAENHELGKFS